METGTARLKRSCKKLKKILRGLSPNPARQNSLEFGDREYNPHIFDTELLRLGIQVHYVDIETGFISPPANTFFLPRADFPEISDACKQAWSTLNDVWGDADHEASKAEDKTNLFSDEPSLFPADLIFTFEEYSFEGKSDISNPFHSTYPPEGVQPSRYGWICDHETEDMRSNPRFERTFKVLDMVPFDLRYYRRSRLDPGVTVTRSSDGDGLLVDRGCHVWASGDIGQSGDDSRPSRDEVVVLVDTMLETMLCTKTSIHDVGPRSYNPMFPTLFFLADRFGKFRILSGYYDGKLHIALTRLLDFSEYALAPPAGMSYLESIDQDKFYRMMNTLLKWAWPIALGGSNEKEEIPEVIDLPTNVQQDTEEPDEEEPDGSNDDWVKV